MTHSWKHRISVLIGIALMVGWAEVVQASAPEFFPDKPEFVMQPPGQPQGPVVAPANFSRVTNIDLLESPVALVPIPDSLILLVSGSLVLLTAISRSKRRR